MDKINFQEQADEIGIDLENLLSLYSLFVNQTESDINEMKDFISTKNSKDLRTITHHIKGASLNLEIFSLVESAKSLEAFSENEDWDQISCEFKDFKKYFIELKTHFKKVGNE